MSRTPTNMRDAHGSFFGATRVSERKHERNPFAPMAFVDLGIIIILFFVTVQFSELVVRPGIKLRLPSADFRGGTHFSKLNTALITLSREGMVFFNDELTTLEGLGTAIVRAAHNNPETKLLIQADLDIDYGTIVKIYNMGIEAGIRDVTMATSIVPDTFE